MSAPLAMLALLVTIDDLPIASSDLHPDPKDREQITKGLMAALAKHKIKAIGLVTWSRVKEPSDLALLDLWLAGGHELGNHSFAHLDYTTTAIDAYLADVDRGAKALNAYLDKRQKKPFRFFRFPFLDEGDTPEKLNAMRAHLKDTGVTNLRVTIDDQDWSFEKPYLAGDVREKERVARNYHTHLDLATRRFEKMSESLFERRVPQILLLHANAIGAVEWDRLFTALEESGHRFATADEVLVDPAFKEDPQLTAEHGYSLWDRVRVVRARERAKEEIKKALDAQAKDWNRGDLPAFCSVYADDATFVSPSGVSSGRQQILDRYTKKYSTREKMGTLSFDVGEVRILDGDEYTIFGDAVPSRAHGASVVLKWKLEYQNAAAASGSSLLVLEPQKDRWLIVQDASM